MVIAVQDVSSIAVANIPPLTGRVPQLADDTRPVLPPPSVIVDLGTASQPVLTYDASGLLETRQPLQTVAQGPAGLVFSPVTESVEFTTAPIFTPLSPAVSPPATPVPPAPNAVPATTPEPIVTAPPVEAEAQPEVVPPDIAPPNNTATPPPPNVPTTTVVETPEPIVSEAPDDAEAEATNLVAPVAPNATPIAAADPTVRAAPVTAESDGGVVETPPIAVAAPTTPPGAPPATPSSPEVAAPPTVTELIAASTPVTTTVVQAAAIAHDNIAGNPFYAAMAASMYVSAMTFRMQQPSPGELDNPAASVQAIGGVRAIAAISFEQNGPADDSRNGTSVFA